MLSLKPLEAHSNGRSCRRSQQGSSRGDLGHASAGMVHQSIHTKSEHAFNSESPVTQHVNSFESFMATLCYLLAIVPSGADGGAGAEASGPATQKALPPWMLRQGITLTSTAPGGQPLGAPFMQANGAGVGSSNNAIASEQDQKEIEVNSGHPCEGELLACSLCCLLPFCCHKDMQRWQAVAHVVQ